MLQHLYLLSLHIPLPLNLCQEYEMVADSLKLCGGEDRGYQCGKLILLHYNPSSSCSHVLQIYLYFVSHSSFALHFLHVLSLGSNSLSRGGPPFDELPLPLQFFGDFVLLNCNACTVKLNLSEKNGSQCNAVL